MFVLSSLSVALCVLLLPTALFWYHIYKNNLFANLHNWTSNKLHNIYISLPIPRGIRRSEIQCNVFYTES